jgi:hypothetical protein
MRRARAAWLMGAIVLTTMVAAPGARAATADPPSTSCALFATLKFKPALVHGVNQRAFIKFRVHLSECTGGTVKGAHGYGGSIGDLRCDSGQVSGRASAKAMLFWNTGDTSGLNFFFHFGQSRLKGRVLDSLFKGEQVSATGFSLLPTDGDCADTPLVLATLIGTLKL